MKIISILLLALFIFGCSKKVEETKITISLPKKSYVMYEPINLQFEWVNNNSQNDSIYSLFLSNRDFLIVKITDQTGNIYSKKLSTQQEGAGENTLSYVVAPGDTLFRSYEINDYGKLREDVRTTPKFWCMGYFPAGKYSVTVIIDKDGDKKYLKPIKTNTVEFEVIEAGTEELEIKKMYFNDKEDKEFLESFDVNIHEKALKQFPNSRFDEYLRVQDIIQYMSKNWDAIKGFNNPKSDSLIQKYDQFITKYPNSQYYLYDGFIRGYFLSNCGDASTAAVKKDKLIEKYPNTLLALNLRSLTKHNKLFVCY